MFLAEKLTADIPAEQFARMPKGIQTNSPAWVIGHLGLYPARILARLEGKDVPTDPQGDAMFGGGSECKDDPAGTIYPPKSELMSRFNVGMQTVIEALPDIPESALNAPNPNERMRGSFPTLGAMTAFLLGGHTMMHLGQVSAWRRCMGLGPCM
jgi:hypothetical protein